MKSPNIKHFPKVKQIIECNDLDAVNVFLQSESWVLLNTYRNRKMGQKPVYCLGRIKDYESQSNYAIKRD